MSRRKPRTVTEWRNAVQLTAAKLIEFELVNAGIVRSSLDRERRALVAAWQAAKVGLLQAQHAAQAAPEAQVGRRRGRPAWTRALYDERRAEAVALAGGIDTDEAVAEHFRGLNVKGDLRGIEPASLARLRRRRALPPGQPGAFQE